MQTRSFWKRTIAPLVAVVIASSLSNPTAAKASKSAEALEAARLKAASKETARAQYIYHHAWWMIRERFYDKTLLKTWSEMEHKHDKELTTRFLPIALRRLARSTGDRYTTIEPTYNRRFRHSYGMEYGIGLHVEQTHALMITPDKGGPADLAGIPAEAELKSIDGKPVTTLEMARSLLLGKYRSHLQLGFVKDGIDHLVPVRRTLKVARAVKDCRLLPENVVYIRLWTFLIKGSAGEIEECLQRYPNARAVVLDLRGNAGGYLCEAQKICSLFVERGSFTAETRRGEVNFPILGMRGKYKHLPVIIAMNCQSASASELLAGCLRDLKSAELIGERSFGKGLAQLSRPITPEWTLTLSQFRIQLPSRECVHMKGLTPTIKAEQNSEDPAIDDAPKNDEGDQDEYRNNSEYEQVASVDSDSATFDCSKEPTGATLTIQRRLKKESATLAAQLKAAYKKLGLPVTAEGIELPEISPFDNFLH